MKKNLSYEVSPLCKSILTHTETHGSSQTHSLQTPRGGGEQQDCSAGWRFFSRLHSLFLIFIERGLCGGAVNKVLMTFGVFNI